MDRNIAVVGCGYWGKNLVRNLAEHGALHIICDSNSAVLRKLEALYLGVNAVLREAGFEESLAVHGQGSCGLSFSEPEMTIPLNQTVRIVRWTMTTSI